jgi:N1-acetylpolyamine oxidase
MVNTKAFQDAFELVPREYHRKLGSLFQGIESMEAAPLLTQTTEPEHPESKPGVGLLEYAVSDFDGKQAFLQDGYVAIIDEIAKPLVEAGAIALETVVTRVDWTRNPVVIETSGGNFTAREVVCTFPLGVLKDSSKDALFVPNLPADKQDAIERLGFGMLDKMFAIYSRPWWNDEPYSSGIKKGLIQTETQGEDDLPDLFLGFTSELSGISVDCNGSVSPDMYRLPIMNLHTLTGQPVLCAFVSCKTATTVEGMKDEDISGLFHRILTQWFGIETPRPDAVHVTRWAQDPYSRGAYSHLITGLSEASHRETLQKPIINEVGGVLRFAGEHCSRDHFAMVHGALLDGWRAADASLQHSE